MLIFKAPVRGFLERLHSVEAGPSGVKATAEPLEAAAFLGAASAKASLGTAAVEQGDLGTSTAENVRQIANVVSKSTTPHTVRSLSNASVLWVDDRPDNNIYERKSMEALGIRFTLSTTTEDALEKLDRKRYDVVISDMGRPPDPRAGYTLLEELKKRKIDIPFIIYAGSNLPQHKAEARKHGAIGSTNIPQELFELVVSAITGHQ